MLENLLGMAAKGGEVVGAEFLGGSSVAWGKSMLVGELSAEVGDTARLGWVEVELEPLMTGAEVVDLEAPVALVAFVAEFTVAPSAPLCNCLQQHVGGPLMGSPRYRECA